MAMCVGVAEKATDPVAAIKASYERGVSDEFIIPITIVDDHNKPVGLIRSEDVCFFFNYRADRGRQMTQSLTESALKLHFTTMTQ
jgi:2,3-bisphosphoglycerate-independent phosphoglycerate mutase